MAVGNKMMTMGLALAMSLGGISGLPVREADAQYGIGGTPKAVGYPKETYNIQKLYIQYNNRTGDVMNLAVEAWKRPPAEDTNTGLTKMSMKLNTLNHNREMDPRSNNNALFIENAVSHSPADGGANATILADVDFSIKPSGYARQQNGVLLITPEPSPDRDDAFNTAYILGEVAFTGKNVPVTFVNEQGESFSNVQYSLNQMKNDASTYGLLINGFRANQTVQFDRAQNNRNSIYRQTVQPFIPGM